MARPKRRWAWKKKHVRRYQSSKAFLWGSPPNSFSKSYIRANRRKEKNDLYKVMKGIEDVDFSPKHHQHSAWWDYY